MKTLGWVMVVVPVAGLLGVGFWKAVEATWRTLLSLVGAGIFAVIVTTGWWLVEHG